MDSSTRITITKVEQLRKPSQRGLCEVEKWKALYRLLFDVEDDFEIPSPYYEYGGQESLNTQLNVLVDIYYQHLPRIMEQEVRRVVSEEMQSCTERLNNRVREMLQNSQQRFQQRITAASDMNSSSESSNLAPAVLEQQFLTQNTAGPSQWDKSVRKL
ncbi:hypothetical protein EJ04DRAFT_599091 [Polyplosphaeria fusca]|uniref:Uncharacterized protein n=1 Tax=Polyplosphaeria fusca TaxID=682080 RepID=A0A9P4R324_9PLEO|nr:hypothetical protein EJ04DRAFT_599091 [Polyplosphaeria fusca]